MPTEARRNQEERSGRAEGKAPENLPPGVKLLRTLEGHQDTVRSVAFDPQGGTLASGSDDNSVKLWDARSGKLVRTLEGHQAAVWSVAFDPQGGTLASGSDDNTVKLWEARTGKLRRTLEGHQAAVWSVAFDPQGATLASGSADHTVKLWDARSGTLVRTLDGHKNWVWSVAFDPQGGTLASGSFDKTVKLWEARTGKLRRTLEGHLSWVLSVAFDPQGGTLASGSGDGTVKLWEARSGKLLRTLEGHTAHADRVAFSPDGRLLASKSGDDTIRLWSCETWETVAVIPEPTYIDQWIPALAFHPMLPLLAAGSKPDRPDDERCRMIHLWELDLDVLLGQRAGVAPAARAVHHTTAKIVLVGDSGVGKTGLGWRLAHGEYREHDSSHGQQFWVLGQLATTRADGTQCEAVLWDLAGQQDYRLIHALSIQDADLALILFDPTDTRDPLGGAEYWLRQLPPACPKILVAARVDRGHPMLTQEELDDFCRRQGIAGGWLATSAATGLGLDELLERMKKAIPWEDKPAVTTDAAFKRIKDFVLALKESPSRDQIIFTTVELRAALEGPSTPGVGPRPTEEHEGTLADDQLLTAVGHLASEGFVRLLTLSTGEQRILLVPELLNNLASSVVLEARRNPRGLGAVEESKLFDNSYGFRELESLSESDQALLLDGTVTAFLENRLTYRCFRESWGEMKLLVFPELMNLKKPQRDDLATEDGASYILSGSTENTFAGLVVLLGYTDLFLRTDQAHDVAWFESDRKDICGVRQVRDDQERALVLLFSRSVSAHVRRVFEGLVEQVLGHREISVRRLRPVNCPHCHMVVERTVMARRLKQGKATVYCEDCGNLVVLPPDEPLTVYPAERVAITHQGAIAELRTRFEEVIYELLRLAQAEKRPAPTCFLSYAWGNADHERWVERRLAMDLEKAGITVVLDRWETARAGASIERFLERIAKADRVLVVGTPAYRQKHEKQDPSTGTAVAAEIKLVLARLSATEAESDSVIPLLLEGAPEESLPPALRTRAFSDFRDDDRYFDTALDLLLGLYRIPSDHPAAKHWRQVLGGGELGRRAMEASGEDELPTDERLMKRALRQVGRHALSLAFKNGKPVVVEQHGQLVWLYADGTTKPYDPGTNGNTGAVP